MVRRAPGTGHGYIDTLCKSHYVRITTLSNSSSNAGELCTVARTPCTSVSLGWRLDAPTVWRSITSARNGTARGLSTSSWTWRKARPGGGKCCDCWVLGRGHQLGAGLRDSRRNEAQLMQARSDLHPAVAHWFAENQQGFQIQLRS